MSIFNIKILQIDLKKWNEIIFVKLASITYIILLH